MCIHMLFMYAEMQFFIRVNSHALQYKNLLQTIYAGYIQTKFDYSIFIKRNRSNIVIMLKYVDDLLNTRNNQSMIEDLKHMLKGRFMMKDLGQIKYFPGIEIARNEQGIVLNQFKYALDLISDLSLIGTKSISTPMECYSKLTFIEYVNVLKINQDDSLLKDPTSYRRLIGKLLYLTVTRPGISYSVQHFNQILQESKQSHWVVALRIVKYIKS